MSTNNVKHIKTVFNVAYQQYCKQNPNTSISNAFSHTLGQIEHIFGPLNNITIDALHSTYFK